MRTTSAWAITPAVTGDVSGGERPATTLAATATAAAGSGDALTDVARRRRRGTPPAPGPA
ncbi:hypothetical protein [Streptomyces sp. HM190]|uniref:hypothetical protein n=1 Tax=Streptomyces sp. HM190 TaxID=2695266 RepID=UPI00135B17B5|nr:hypothetical protein [Streptomyces sp. HM190]